MQPEKGSRWARKGYNSTLGKYNAYTVLFITNGTHEHSRHPKQVVYIGDNGNEWSLPLNEWPGNLIPETVNNSNLIGVEVKINDPNVLTNGSIGIVEKYNKEHSKYKVNFGKSWVGYYERKHLELI